MGKADRLACLTNWYDALPIYTEIERDATTAGNRRDALYAKFGRLRGLMQTLPLPDISEQIAADLETSVARRGPRLRLRGLTVKGDIDLEWDVQAAQLDWQAVRQLAQELGDKGWENRANGELGIVAFLKGNTGAATALVQQAYQTAEKSGDVGGQLRYLGTIANGLLLAGYAPLAMGYVDRALKFENEHPETDSQGPAVAGHWRCTGLKNRSWGTLLSTSLQLHYFELAFRTPGESTRYCMLAAGYRMPAARPWNRPLPRPRRR